MVLNTLIIYTSVSRVLLNQPNTFIDGLFAEVFIGVRRNRLYVPNEHPVEYIILGAAGLSYASRLSFFFVGDYYD